MRLRGTLITGLTREPSMPECFGFGAPMTNTTFFAVAPVPMLTTPDTGVGGRPPPASVLPVGVTQNSGIEYDFATPRLALQLCAATAPVEGRLVPKKETPPIDVAALTTFSPCSSWT